MEIGGGDAAGAAAAAERLMAQGVDALLSFGLAGGLDPALKPGALVIPAWVLDGAERWPTDPTLSARFGPAHGALQGGGDVLTTAAAKRRLHLETGALAVDLESAALARAAARHGLPFAVLRAICDPAARDLPPAAQIALDAQGRIGMWRVVRSVLTRPGQIGGLLALARDAGAARRALDRVVTATVA